MPARDRDAVELRAVAPLVVTATRQLIGPVLLVTNGQKTIGMTSAELVRQWDPGQMSVLTGLDGATAASIAMSSWSMGRYSGLALIDLDGPVAPTAEVAPLPLANVCASTDTRGAPSGIVTILPAAGTTSTRALVAVHVDAVDTGGMSDDLGRLASPIDAAHAQLPVEGAVLFTWFPPDPVLGRKSEVLAVAMTYPYRHGAFAPRAPLPAIAEMIGLDDLGRALIHAAAPVPDRPELHEITGEITEAAAGGAPGLGGPKRERT
ncbi:MAG: hypothetical protein JNL83_11360 [Myxococcales bacterium]|nr:hypothetical protein [Myxococcales bacterium]